MNKIVFSIIITILIILLSVYYFVFYKANNIDNTIKNDDLKDLIVVFSPIKDAEITSPITVSGRAKSDWYNDGVFPISILDSYGNIIADGHATAQGKWKDNDFVNFIGTIQFDNYIKGQKATLKLVKGLTKKDEITLSLKIPIIFK